MAVLRWPYQIEDVRQSAIPIRQKGLVGWWPAGTNPEYPDDPAVGQRTYFQDEWATADGWSVTNGSVAVSGGIIKFTSTATAAMIPRRTFDWGLKTGRFRARASRNMITGIVSNTSGFITIKTVSVTTDWNVFDAYNTQLASTEFALVINSATTGDWIEIDFIYIGTGAYLPNSFLDLSGSGNHGTIFGCTPVETPYGRGLSFDGVNDYVSTAEIGTMSSITAGGWVYQTEASTSIQRPIISQWNTAIQSWMLDAVSGAVRLIIYYTDGTTSAISIPEVLNTWVFYQIILDSTERKGYIYKNGVVATSFNFTPGKTLRNTAQTLWLGRKGDSATVFFAGTIAQPRIYNRALSASEVYDSFITPELYQAVPQYPQQDGFGEQPQDGTIRSMMDSGPAKTRQRFTALTTQYSLTYQVNDYQKQVLDGFYRYVTRGGSLAFEWPHPVGYNEQARFLRPPSYTPNGPEYIANVQLEVLP